VLRESDASYYLREERMGWILGPTSAARRARFADGVPSDFGKELFPGDLDRLLPHVEAAMKRVPCLEHCGHQDDRQRSDFLHAGRQPDGRSGVGPAQSWLNEGHSFGVTAAGGCRLAARRVDRRGRSRHRHAGCGSAALRRLHRQALHGAQERGNVSQRSSRSIIRTRSGHDARPAKTSPVYEKLDAMGAVWGQRYGWERANWFAPEGRACGPDGASAAPTISSTSATSAGGCASTSA
jgi:dimethylglycine dehydrogenase